MAQMAEGPARVGAGACARVLRPLVRLALAFGVKHAHLEELLRDLMVDEARRAWLRKGSEPNISQLSVTTGLEPQGGDDQGARSGRGAAAHRNVG